MLREPTRDPLQAVWRPAWHDLDQTVVVGDRDTFVFVRGGVPSYAPITPGDRHLMFWNNAIARVDDTLIADATITAIHHERFGSIRALLVGPLDLVIIAGRDTLVIDAEQEPGRIESSGEYLDATTFTVELSHFIERGSLSEFLKGRTTEIAERERCESEERWKRLLDLSELPEACRR